MNAAPRSVAIEAAPPRPGEAPALAAAHRVDGRASWWRVGWLLPPLLALTAYWPSLRVGFLADDYILLYAARHRLTGALLLPDPNWFFYRPFGTVVTWYLGWRLWGLDALPYHLLGLLVHAGVALALALWLAEVSGRRGLGWLAGALFAVFPLHLEAVGWLAAQWDAWAALFGVLGLWLFTAWWRRPGAGPRWYLPALLAYSLGLFSKENMLIFLPLYPLAALATRPPADGAAWRRLGRGLGPFAGMVGLNVGLRLAFWGNLGGYAQGHPTGDLPYWGSLVNAARLLLAPINATIFDPAVALGVGVVSGLGLLAGLLRFGGRQRRLLGLAGAWLLLAAAPVLVLPLGVDDLGGNRFLYLAAAGYCVAWAILLYPLLADVGRARPFVGVGVALLLLAGMVVSWVQLESWHTGTVQADAAAQELRRLIPPQPRPQGMVWYVENGLITYRGVYVLWALGNMRYFTSGEGPLVKYVDSAPATQLGTDTGDEFALRFAYDAPSARYHVDRLAGLTADSPPPAGEQVGAAYQLWDFRDCAPAAVQAWQPAQMQQSCLPTRGLQLQPTGNPSLQGPDLALPAGFGGARFLRLRVAARYPAPLPSGVWSTTWAWAGPGAAEQTAPSLPIKADGQVHIYWTFVPVVDLGARPISLSLAPANGPLPAQIQWIALDLVQ